MQQDPTNRRSPAEVADLEARVQELTALTRSLEERAFDLYTICQVGKSFSGDDPVKISEILVSAMADKVGAKQAVVLGANRDRSEFRPIYSQGVVQDELRDVHYRPRQGILWQLVKAGEPFAVIDSQGNPMFRRDFEETGLERLSSSWWVPLRTKDEILGIVTLDRPCNSEGDSRFFHLLASQGATALENARLYQELEASRRELRHQMNKLSMLYDVGRALNVIDDRNRLLTEILGRAADIAEAEKGSIMLFDETNEELVVQVVRGIDAVTEQKILNGEIECKRLKRGEGIAGTVAGTGEPLVVNDVREGSAFVDSNTSRVSSILCVPLRVHGDVIGVLNITNKIKGKQFSEDDLQIIQQVADQAAVAIHNARLYEMAVTDSLTRLYIRRHLFQRLAEELRRARRYGHPISVLMIDIDHFKRLNDTFGHPCGDKVLVEVSRILKRSVRETDLVGRYGGEEFCLVLPETDAEGAVIVADRVHSSLAALDFQWDGTPITVTVSGGIASFPEQASAMEAVIACADAALYHSKRNGRNRTTIYHSGLTMNPAAAPPPAEEMESDRSRGNGAIEDGVPGLVGHDTQELHSA